jgi:Rad3-related DNA helicase
MQSLSELGVPAKFTEWRGGQDDAFKFLTLDPCRVKACALPTGVGKSLLAVAYANWLGRPAVILTSTKALQRQYMQDFESIGMLEVKGMGNYPCREWARTYPGKQVGCDLGPCIDGDACEYKAVGCHYYDAIAKARRVPLVIANYSFWFTQAALGREDPLGPRPLVICDEGHAAIDELSRFVGVRFSNDEVSLHGKVDWNLEQWRAWAKRQLPTIQAAIRQATSLRDVRFLRTMEQRCTKLDRITDPGNWCIDMFESKHVKFEPVWASSYVERYLAQGAKELVLLSATLRPHHMDLFGYPDYSFHELDSPFPVDRRPITWIPTARVTRKTEEEAWPQLIARIDEIIDARPDRKGLIHTVSFARAKRVLETSRHRDIMLINMSRDTNLIVDQFRASPAPRVLVSPSVDTGFDFPYNIAEYQVIMKCPFPVPTDPLVKARSEHDKMYHRKVAVTRIVQMAGRVVRAEDDAGETFIIDDAIHWLITKTKPYFPRWFRAAFNGSHTPPAPPAPLDKRDN